MKTRKLNLEDFAENQLIRIQKANVIGGQPPLEYYLDENDESQSQPVSSQTTGNPLDPTAPTPTSFIHP